MIDAYKTVMDAEQNPLRLIPKAQRFQLMTYLSLMWSTLFCFGIGYWAIYGQLVALHILVALGMTFTGYTFFSVRPATHRDKFKSKDGTVLYDDIWGAR